MSDKDIPWQTLFDEVLKEEDPKTLANKVEELEAAIFFRLQELGTGPDVAEERRKLNEAIKALFAIKVKKLGFPLPPSRSFLRG